MPTKRKISELTKLSRLIDLCKWSFNSQVQDIEKKIRLESSKMELFDVDGLEYLPVEVAVNTICLMAYNALVTSGYFQDVLSYEDYYNLPNENKDLVKNIDLSRISINSFSQAKKPYKYEPETKAFILGAIRHGLCHGNIHFHLPPKKSGQRISFKDVVLSFNSERTSTMVSATIDDFYKLFSSSGFFAKRDKIDPEMVEINEFFDSQENLIEDENITPPDSLSDEPVGPTSD